MKHPQSWLRWFFLFILFIVLSQYALLTLFFPQYAVRIIERLTGGQVTVELAKVSPQLTTLLTGLRATQNSPESAFSIEQIVARPRQLWLVPRLLEIASIAVEPPFTRFTRTQAGTSRWPRMAAQAVAPALSREKQPASRLKQFVNWLRSRWRLKVSTVRFSNGTIEFIDQQPAMPFHLALENITASLGPITFPDDGNPVSFAVRGLLTGYQGRSAPVYCSGWVARKQGNMAFSCQMEPLALSIFDSYFQEYPVIRVYSATVASTGKWSAKANQLDARIRLEMDHLDEGDISVRGHTIFNIKRLAKEGERQLIAEVKLSGQLQDIASWQGEFIPGNAAAENLAEQLLERKIKILQMPVGSHHVGLHVASASEAVIQDGEATSKSVSEALELLAQPVAAEPETVPPAAAASEVVPPAPSTQEPPPVAPENVDSSVPEGPAAPAAVVP